MYRLIVLLFLINWISGANRFDKLLLFNSNSYYGIFVNSIEQKVYFKILGNSEIDSVNFSDIQLLQLSSGNKIIKNGIIVGHVKIEDLAIRNVRYELENSFKWKAFGMVNVPISFLSGSLFWNLSKNFSSSNKGISPAFFLGFSSIYYIQFIFSNTNILIKGLPRGINDEAKKKYEEIFIQETKKQRRNLLFRGVLIGTLGAGMSAYLAKNLEFN